MRCIKSRKTQAYIIDVITIETTDWQDVSTKPFRTLHDDVKNLPHGLEFITEFLKNDHIYVPMS